MLIATDLFKRRLDCRKLISREMIGNGLQREIESLVSVAYPRVVAQFQFGDLQGRSPDVNRTNSASY